MLMSCSPSVDLILTYIALMRLGVTIVPANTGYTDRELEYIVDDAKPVAAIVDEPAKNKSVVRDNKRVQLQWEKNSATVANFLEGKGGSLKYNKGNPTTKVSNPKFSEEPLMCHCWQQCMSLRGGISASMVVSAKLLASSMKRANATFVFVIARSCVPKSELILLI